jgi:hypothetical protein
MSESSSPGPRLPVYYAGAVPLFAAEHGSCRLLPGDAAFAAAVPAVPLTVSEFGRASHSFPIVFAAGDPAPVALMGLENTNLFIEDGAWADDAYVPAYVRRYPFLLIETQDKNGYALGIDQTSNQIAKSGRKGEPLFEKGAPGAVTKRALEFCRLFNEDHLRGQAFCKALVEADLLVDRRADAALPDGRRMGVLGFTIVDAARFAKLDDAIVIEWHRKGWLALVHFHLASLERFSDLLRRQGKRGATPLSPPQESEAVADEDAITH